MEYNTPEGDIYDARHQHGRQHNEDVLSNEWRLLARVLRRGESDAITKDLHCADVSDQNGEISDDSPGYCDILATATTIMDQIHALCRIICHVCVIKATANRAVAAMAGAFTGT